MPSVVVEALDHREPSVAERIHALQLAAYTQEAKLLGVSDFPPLRRTFADLEASHDQFFGAFLEKTLAGVVSLERGQAIDTLCISSLVVAPASQRLGIGRALLGTVVERFASQTLVVSTGAANTPALALYEQLGFTEIGRQFVGTEALEVVRLCRLPERVIST